MKRKAILSLFDYTTETMRPWADAGFMCFCVDIQHAEGFTATDHENIIKCGESVLDDEWLEVITERFDIVFGAAFPPCTDLAVSGARHFASKLAANPEYRNEAMAMVYRSRDIFEALGCPYMIENPVSVISSEWRKPDHVFHPYQYGGYIPMGQHVHPRWPEYIAARDAYPKKTCLWTGGGFTMPLQAEVDCDAAAYSIQFRKLGGKSMKTKNIRSATPRGFARALYLYNAPDA